MELRNGGNSWDWFVLAMAEWKLGNRDAARVWYDKAVVWMENNPTNEDVTRFRAEAAALLGPPQAVTDRSTRASELQPAAANASQPVAEAKRAAER
ncbi:MAG: hypothetical protein L0228_15880 [Planctomycetes bacterium]|nr:hypothetical protein [Planctomycetota bacterium]